MAPAAQIIFPNFKDFLFARLLTYTVRSLFLLFSIGLIGSGISKPRRRGSKVKVASGSLIAAAAVYLIYFTYAPESQYNVFIPHQNLDLDFSTSRSPPPGQWFSSVGSDQGLAYQGWINLHLKLPNSFEFAGPSVFVLLNRRGDQVNQVVIHSPSLSLNDACDLTEHYLAAWDLDRRDFTQWRIDRQSGKRDPQDTEFFSYKNIVEPRRELELHQVLDSWYRSLTITWSNDLTTRPSK